MFWHNDDYMYIVSCEYWLKGTKEFTALKGNSSTSMYQLRLICDTSLALIFSVRFSLSLSVA